MWIVPTNLQYSHSAPGTAGLNWDLKDLGFACAQSLTWRGKDSQQPTWQRRLKRENWLKHLSTRMLRPSLTNHFEDWWTSCLQDTRANRSVQPENEKELKTQDTCGHTSQTELSLADQQQSSSRTSKDTLPLGCVTSCQTWDDWVTEQRGDCLLRLKSVRLTNEKESTSLGGFPTPVVSDSWTPSNDASFKREWDHGNLRGVAAANWPTPRVSDEQGASSTRVGQSNAQLREKVLENNWPTPTVAEAEKIPNQANYGQKALSNHPAIVGVPNRPKMEKDRSGQQGQKKNNTTGKNPEQWPTPRALETDENLETWEKRRERKEKEGIHLHKPLSVKVRQEDWPTPIAGNPGSRKPGTGGKVLSEEARKEDVWPTPLEDDANNINPSDKRMKTLVSATKGNGQRLNPNWVEQLMGVPAGWTQIPTEWIDSDCWEMG